MTMAQTSHEPSDAEVDRIFQAFDDLSQYISPKDGTINSAQWQVVHQILSGLSEYERWIGLCNLESALFESDFDVTCTQMTLYELFKIAYEQGLEAL